MRYAIVSDIHANLQAWQAVRDDMYARGVDVMLCLGDVIGYGPCPAEVLDDVRLHCDNFVLGNHDAVIAGKLDPVIFNDHARYLIDWTARQLGDEPVDFFADVPYRMGSDDMVCVHAEASCPERWSYIVNPEDARSTFECNDATVTFIGHTHVPLVCRWKKGKIDGRSGIDFDFQSSYRYVVNVGSVGDPRDGFPEASYAIYDDEAKRIEFRRVPFNYDRFRRDLAVAKLRVQPYFLSLIDDPQEATRKPSIDDMGMGDTTQIDVSELGTDTASIRIASEAKRKKRRKPKSTPVSVGSAPVPIDRGPVKAIIAVIVVFCVFAVTVAWLSRSKAPVETKEPIALQPLTPPTPPVVVEKQDPPKPAPVIVASAADPEPTAEPPDAPPAVTFMEAIHLPLDEPLSKDLAAQGSPSVVDGLAGQSALHLDGNTSLTLGGSDDLYTESVTVMLWIRLKRSLRQPRWATIVSTGEKGWRLELPGDRDGQFSFAANDGADLVAVSSKKVSFNDGRWHHVAAIFNAEDNAMRIYVDTEWQGKAKLGDIKLGKADKPITIGASPDMPNRYITADIHDVRIIPQALNLRGIKKAMGETMHQQVKLLKDAEPPPAESEPVEPETAVVEAVDPLLRDVSLLLLKGKRKDAVLAAAPDPNVHDLLQEVLGRPRRIMDTFAEQQGRSVEVRLTRAAGTFEIVSVDGGTVKAKRMVQQGSITETFTFNDLAVKEKVNRLGDLSDPGNALYVGLIALKMKRYTTAARYFERSGTPLGETLAIELEKAMN
jgi:predicted phosphodiesterase